MKKIITSKAVQSRVLNQVLREFNAILCKHTFNGKCDYRVEMSKELPKGKTGWREISFGWKRDKNTYFMFPELIIELQEAATPLIKNFEHAFTSIDVEQVLRYSDNGEIYWMARPIFKVSVKCE